ncbi:bidirectional sugar transporter SWEET4-like [Apium graveolens]|uniref:bidirectional sugar transporter SWEET4-like n=1 Tax=Apium graveolens TaxID=4045 RepID=UPI003D7BF64F
MYVGGAFLIELVVVGLVSGLVIGLAHTILARTAIVGGFCFIFGLVMYVPRISGWFTICRTRSVEGDMPFPLLVTNTLNDLCWLIYASIRFDCILWFTYCCGVLVGVVQLVLHRIYRKCIKVSCEYNKLAEVPLQGIDIGDDVHSKLAVEEVRLQKTETYDDKKLATTEVQLQEIVAV